jgi:hypothetical protein
MKRFVCIGLSFALVMGMSATAGASANGRHGAHSKAKRCKRGKVFRKGKCRKPQIPPLVVPPAHSIVRATLSWDGPAYMSLQVWGAEGRAGYFPGEGGVLNEIPNAHYSGVAGAPGPGTETFVDDLFQGDYGSVPVPNGNRGFAFGECTDGSAGPEASHVTMMWLTSWGLVDRSSWTVNPSGAGRSCATMIN